MSLRLYRTHPIIFACGITFGILTLYYFRTLICTTYSLLSLTFNWPRELQPHAGLGGSVVPRPRPTCAAPYCTGESQAAGEMDRCEECVSGAASGMGGDAVDGWECGRFCQGEISRVAAYVGAVWLYDSED
jgi:hypothetical protein